MSKAEVSLSSVVVATDEPGYAKECLRALVDRCSGLDHELIVVDNASRAGLAEWVPSGSPSATILRTERRLRIGQARNLGLRASSGEYVLFLDADARLCPGSVESLLGFIRRNVRVGIAGPRLCYPDGRFQLSCRSFQNWTSFLRRGLGLGPTGRDRELSRRARESAAPIEVDWVMGACHMAPRRALGEVGGFDEGYRLYYSDVDLCLRMRNAGWRVCYVPSANCIHHYQRKSAGFPPNQWTLVHLLDFLRFRRRYREIEARGHRSD